MLHERRVEWFNTATDATRAPSRISMPGVEGFGLCLKPFPEILWLHDLHGLAPCVQVPGHFQNPACREAYDEGTIGAFLHLLRWMEHIFLRCTGS